MPHVHLVPAAIASLFASALVVADPFMPGVRWVHQASAAEPWIPGSVAFAGAESLAWAAAAGASPRFELLDLEAPPVGREAASLTGAVGSLAVAAGRRADRVFGLRQVAAPDAWQRSTRVEGYDPVAASAGASFAPSWSHDLGTIGNGPARLACDEEGERVVAAVFDPGGGTLRVDWIDGSTGELAARADLAGFDPGALVLAFSADGTRTALVAGRELAWFGADGALLERRPLGGTTTALAIDGRGRCVAVGVPGGIELLRSRSDGALARHLWIAAPAGWRAARVALDDDARTLAVATWNAVSGVDQRLELWDVAGGTRLWERVRLGVLGGPQDLPVALALTPDGRRLALGTWGDGLAPELCLFEREGPPAILEVDLPGSVNGIALDDSGTRVLVTHKDRHANHAAATGAVRLLDTGERDLQRAAPVALTAELSLVARGEGALAAAFLIGIRAPSARPFAGVEGELGLGRRRLALHSRPTDAEGRAELRLAGPSLPGALGSSLAAQVLFSGPSRRWLSGTVVDLVVLGD